MLIDAGQVVLRPYQRRDRGMLIALLGQPDVMGRVLDERAFSQDEAEQFIDTQFRTDGRLGYETVSLKSTDEAIGLSGFRACRYLDADDVEFGWVLAKEYHGRGFATALGEGLIVHALESWQLPRVLAACHPLNQASERVLCDKLHMRFERDVEPKPGFRRRVYSAARGWVR
jgi:RimJ/RimL family protein N-acetyltransferase